LQIVVNGRVCSRIYRRVDLKSGECGYKNQRQTKSHSTNKPWSPEEFKEGPGTFLWKELVFLESPAR
jgi:hypothetical protein